MPQHRTHRIVDEILLENLRDEREGARRSQIALDHLDVIVTSDELDIEGTGDGERFGDPPGDPLDPPSCLEVETLRREYHRGIARVNPSILDMFTDGITDHIAILGHSVQFDLLGPGDELRYHHRMLARNIGSGLQVDFHLLVGVRHTHRSTTEYIGWADQYRVSTAFRKGTGIFNAGQLAPLGLVDPQIVEQ